MQIKQLKYEQTPAFNGEMKGTTLPALFDMMLYGLLHPDIITASTL